MKPLVEQVDKVTGALLNTIAYMPTSHLDVLIDASCWKALSDADFMRIAVLLAKKSVEEGGCPIGAVIINNESRKIVGKGHNTLVQESHPYNHGETSAIRDAGRIDFSKTTLFTTLSPCDVCASLLYMRGVSRVVVGDITNASGNELLLRQKGVNVEVLEDEMGISLYAKFRQEKPHLEMEDWRGVAELANMQNVFD
ncbi:Cytosine deaminase [Pseudoalteromonas luteoviolacea B = ATCC 29581]|nr:Cytosine deaminase [Pseudoalteromonas luteoviolacea B = ATCC 29581]